MITFLRILLIPFSIFYSLIILIRNYFYDTGLFKSYKISKPILSIGNITTGGTGKSPFTIFLAKYFLNNNIKPSIISRGYKGKSSAIEVVFNGEGIISTPDKCGDEPYMMASRLLTNYKNFFVITGSDRVTTAEYAISKFNPEIIILDDAFQHRKIKRNLDIVLIDTEGYLNNIFSNSIILPSGNLRESCNSLKRADIIIQNNKFKKIEKLEKLTKFGKDVFILNYTVKGFFDANGNDVDIKEKNIIAFSGIAKPDSFFGEIKKYGCKLLKSYAFRDHHNYTDKDLKEITSDATKETIFITTEKDFVKINKSEIFQKYFNVLFMKIELNLEEQDKFFTIVNDIIKTKNN